MKPITKYLVAAVATVLLTSVTIYKEAQAQVICEAVDRLAKSIMEARQSGAALSDMLKVLDGPNNKTTGPFVRAVVMEAFEQPRYSTESMQQKTITEFANQQMLMCVKIMNQ